MAIHLQDLARGSTSSESRSHKDKLANAKEAERARREVQRRIASSQKAAKEQERLEGAAVMRRLRSLNSELNGTTSKRSRKDARQAAKKEKRVATGAECEHGVWRCKICFPSTKARK